MIFFFLLLLLEHVLLIVVHLDLLLRLVLRGWSGPRDFVVLLEDSTLEGGVARNVLGRVLPGGHCDLVAPLFAASHRRLPSRSMSSGHAYLLSNTLDILDR